MEGSQAKRAGPLSSNVSQRQLGADVEMHFEPGGSCARLRLLLPVLQTMSSSRLCPARLIEQENRAIERRCICQPDRVRREAPEGDAVLHHGHEQQDHQKQG